VFRDTAGIHGDRHKQKPDQRTTRAADNDGEAIPGLNHTAIIRLSAPGIARRSRV